MVGIADRVLHAGPTRPRKWLDDGMIIHTKGAARSGSQEAHPAPSRVGLSHRVAVAWLDSTFTVADLIGLSRCHDPIRSEEPEFAREIAGNFGTTTSVLERDRSRTCQRRATNRRKLRFPCPGVYPVSHAFATISSALACKPVALATI